MAQILDKQDELKLAGALGENEYEQAAHGPAFSPLAQEEMTRLREGMRYYTTGAGFDTVFADAMAKFREMAKSRFRKGGKKKSQRIADAKAYYVEKTAPHRDDLRTLAVISATVLKAYEQVFHERLYPAGQTPWEQLNRMGIQ